MHASLRLGLGLGSGLQRTRGATFRRTESTDSTEASEWREHTVTRTRTDRPIERSLRGASAACPKQGHLAALQHAATSRKNRLVDHVKLVTECDLLFTPVHEHARECTICYSDDVTTRLDACGHQIMCNTCVKMLVATVSNTCPLCRTVFSGYLCNPRFGFCEEFTAAMPWMHVQRNGDIRFSRRY